MAKFLWRKGFLRVPTSCTTDEHGTGDSSTCRASCPAEVRMFRFLLGRPRLNPDERSLHEPLLYCGSRRTCFIASTADPRPNLPTYSYRLESGMVYPTFCLRSELVSCWPTKRNWYKWVGKTPVRLVHLVSDHRNGRPWKFLQIALKHLDFPLAACLHTSRSTRTSG